MSVSEGDTGTSQVIRRGEGGTVPTISPANGAGRVPNGKPPRLQGIVIATNSPTTRRRVYEAYWHWPLLPVESVPLVVALYDNVDRRRRLARARDALEARVKANTQRENRHLAVLTADTGVRQVEEEIRHKDTVILRQLDALGWTPTAMARLGIDLGRLQTLDLASAMAEGAK